MQLSDLISFRRDLLFQGAVQIGWFETDQAQSEKAATHFVFHGPDYHGVSELDIGEAGSHQLIDTANFTLDILEHLKEGALKDEPFLMAIAGWGMGKSHLGLTLSQMLSDSGAEIAKNIIENIYAADRAIGQRIELLLYEAKKPYLVLAINGMQDFDLVSEITRQVLLNLTKMGLNTAPLEDLKPRFKTAQNFTKAFYSSLTSEFQEAVALNCTEADIIQRLKHQDELTFKAVNDIYESKMGEPIRAVTQESLQQFMRVLKDNYCGQDKPLRGVLIIFDEFGRYLEFAVQKPHIAGSGGLQQLFEGVQENGESIFLLCLIQYELKAYMSRVAPELRDSLNRYVSRYDSLRKVRLSTNLETLIANLLEKKDKNRLDDYIDQSFSLRDRDILMNKFKNWFPDLKSYSLWNDPDRFRQIIQKGCWPLHPLTTWFLYRLTSVGKSLQQRSALSFISDAYDRHKSREINGRPWTIAPIDLCTDDMVKEFLASEQYGQQGAVAHAFENAVQRYEKEFSSKDRALLKAILLSSKIGLRVQSQDECDEALAMFSGVPLAEAQITLSILLKEFGVVEWNKQSCKYEIVGDAVPKKAFIAYLRSKVEQIGVEQRAQLFAQKMKNWGELNCLETDFGVLNNISTKEWHYMITCSNVSLLDSHVEYALRAWRDAMGTDEYRGQLIYCYVGAESDIEKVREHAKLAMLKSINEIGYSIDEGAPIAIVLLNDEDGILGERIAEYWILNEQLSGDEAAKFANFILDRQKSALDEMLNQFRILERKRDLILSYKKEIVGNRIKNILTNLFDVLYQSHIPFPFDGFYTSKGNAAKDCQLFTIELFSGSLNQAWISARNVQQRNRAVTVLHKSWQVLAQDGSIRKIPGNKSVGKIVEWLDSKLKKESRLNLGIIARQLCKPPYGCNIASAGMLLGVFAAARKDKIAFVRRGSTVGVENWLREAFQGSFLNMAILDETNLQLISEEESDEWTSLLDEWDFEKTYLGQVHCLSKAGDLEKRISIPPALHYRFELLQEHAFNALDILEKWGKDVEEQNKFLDRAYEKGNAGNLSRCGASLVKLMEEMLSNSDCWVKEQFEEIDNLTQQTKQATVQFFPNWLKSQVVIDPKVLGDFKHQMLKLVGENLKALGLDKEFHQLEGHVEGVTSEVDRRAKIKVIIDEVRSFIDSHCVTPATKVAELRGWLNASHELNISLEEAKGRDNIPQITKAQYQLKDFEKNCKEQLDKHESRASSIWNTELNSIQDVKDTAQEVRTLITIYDGIKEDIEDFYLMSRLLRVFENHYQQIAAVELTDDEIDAKCSRFIKEVNEMLGEDDEIPWEIEETYERFMISIREQRNRYAETWLAEHVPKEKMIYSLDAKMANQLRAILQAPPAVLNKEQLKKVEAALHACIKRLNDLEVDGLLERFKSLSKEAKKIFLKNLKEMLQSH